MNMEKKSTYMPFPEFPREIRREIHEHEVLLSFTLDEDAVWFEGWWNDKGHELYAEYLYKAKNDMLNGSFEE